MTSDVFCAKCLRPVADSVTLCDTCLDAFVEALLTVPGLITDVAITAARLDRMSTGRVGGKSASTPLPIRITGKTTSDKEIDERDTVARPYAHVATDDQMPYALPLHILVNSLTTWGRVFEEHYRVSIPLYARGLTGLVMANRKARDDRPLPQPDVARIPTYRIARVTNDDGTVTAERVRGEDRPVARVPLRDPNAVALGPATPAEKVAIWLAMNPHLIRSFEAANDLVDDVTKAIERVKAAVDRSPELWYLGPCPTIVGTITHITGGSTPKTCGSALRAEPGETWVRCGRCRNQHEVERIIADAKKRTEDHLWTLAKIGQYLAALGYEIPNQVLYDLDWHPRKSVPKRGWLHTDSQGGQRITGGFIHRDDPPVYRVGDVVRYFERKATDQRVKVKGSTA